MVYTNRFRTVSRINWRELGLADVIRSQLHSRIADVSLLHQKVLAVVFNDYTFPYDGAVMHFSSFSLTAAYTCAHAFFLDPTGRWYEGC